MSVRDLMKWRRRDVEPSFTGLQRAMNDLFADFEQDFPMFQRLESGQYMPSIDVSETDEAVEVTAELPGMSEKEVEVTLTGNRLTLKGEKKSEKEEKKKDFYRMERSFGSFMRTVQLPAEVQADKVVAEHKDGVLKVVLPKLPAEKAGAKKIDVKGK